MNAELLQAIDLALDGQWDAAHGIVQEYDSDRMASWIHAVLHKIEGDRSNSLYWYRRAGQGRLRRSRAHRRVEGDPGRDRSKVAPFRRVATPR